MPSVSESTSGGSSLAAALAVGLDTIDEQSTITFTAYNRVVLPLDGYVFWVNSGNSEDRTGSLHYATNKEQNEDETVGVNSVMFTTTEEVANLNADSETSILIGTIDGILFAFTRRGPFYEQAGLYHYAGESIQPALQTQLLDTLDGFDLDAQIVSNSLPLWLSLAAPYSVDAITTQLLAYPSADPGNGTPYWDSGILAKGTGIAVSPSGLTAQLLSYPTTDPGDGTPYWDDGFLAKGVGSAPAVSLLTAQLLAYTFGSNQGGIPYWDDGLFCIPYPRITPSALPGLGGLSYPVFPSYLVPDNLHPPYAVVHIAPETTQSLQAAPEFDTQFSQWQLVRERAKITLYGLTNQQALDFVALVNWRTVLVGDFGIMNMPVVRDEKRTQPEIGVIAMKKTVEFDINYHQATARDVARQLILSAFKTLTHSQE